MYNISNTKITWLLNVNIIFVNFLFFKKKFWLDFWNSYKAKNLLNYALKIEKFKKNDSN